MSCSFGTYRCGESIKDPLCLTRSICPFPQIKPDGVQRGLVGEIIKRFEAKGYKLLAMKLTQPSKEHMETHYEDLKDKKFFPGLIQYMTSGPVVAMVWSGKNVVAEGRKMLGKLSA